MVLRLRWKDDQSLRGVAGWVGTHQFRGWTLPDSVGVDHSMASAGIDSSQASGYGAKPG